MKDITDADYMDGERVCKYFEIKKLYVQSNTLLLADVFELSKYVSWNIWTWSCSFSYCTSISILGSLKVD